MQTLRFVLMLKVVLKSPDFAHPEVYGVLVLCLIFLMCEAIVHSLNKLQCKIIYLKKKNATFSPPPFFLSPCLAKYPPSPMYLVIGANRVLLLAVYAHFVVLEFGYYE